MAVWTAFFTGLFLGFVVAFLVIGVFLMVRDWINE